VSHLVAHSFPESFQVKDLCDPGTNATLRVNGHVTHEMWFNKRKKYEALQLGGAVGMCHHHYSDGVNQHKLFLRAAIRLSN
jgi:hypothetical protein